MAVCMYVSKKQIQEVMLQKDIKEFKELKMQGTLADLKDGTIRCRRIFLRTQLGVIRSYSFGTN